MSLIDKNSKLFQKFIQNKSKKTQVSQSSLEKRSMPKQVKEVINDQKLISINIMNDQNINTINIPTIEPDQKINMLLKQQLQKQRKNKLDSSQQQIQHRTNQSQDKQIYQLKQQIYQLKLQASYLNKQNLQLKQKIQEEQIKVGNLQIQNKRLLQNKGQDQFKLDSSKIKQLQNELNALREQNYLAKDYLYKLTLKLYQSKKYNQQLQAKLASSNHHQAIKDKQETKYFNQTVTSQRNRQFTNSRSISIKKAPQQMEPIKKQISLPDTQRQLRIQQIRKELQQLQEAKVFNGKSRRRKIELQRQLQRQLQQLNSL